jgi:acetolactate synthase regulatory subunit
MLAYFRQRGLHVCHIAMSKKRKCDQLGMESPQQDRPLDTIERMKSESQLKHT